MKKTPTSGEHRSKTSESDPLLSRRRFLGRGAALLGAAIAPPLGKVASKRAASTDRPVAARAVEIVAESTVIDMLGLLTLDWPSLYRWQSQPESLSAAEFDRLKRGGIDIFHPAIEPPSPEPQQAALRWLRRWDDLLREHRSYFTRIATVDDLLRVSGEGRLGLLVGFQNSDHFRAPADVANFHRLGQRVSQLTYNHENLLGGGCRDPFDRGLKPFGADVVQAMNGLGMAIDLSHCGDRTCLDACAASRKPVLITHANCRALVGGQPRNKPDQVIRAMAKTGGVMGITVVRAFVGPGSPTIANWLAHFDHVVRLVGVEHVGVGSDLDVDGREPLTGRLRPAYRIRGLDPSRRVFQLAEELLRRGYRAEDVGLVLGGNFLRALREIWSVAAECAPQRPGAQLGPECVPARRDPFLPPPGE